MTNFIEFGVWFCTLIDVPDPAEPVTGPHVASAGPVALGRFSTDPPVAIVYRRPIEARSARGAEREQLLLEVLAELLAPHVGRDELPG